MKVVMVDDEMYVTMSKREFDSRMEEKYEAGMIFAHRCDMFDWYKGRGINK